MGQLVADAIDAALLAFEYPGCRHRGDAETIANKQDDVFSAVGIALLRHDPLHLGLRRLEIHVLALDDSGLVGHRRCDGAESDRGQQGCGERQAFGKF